MISMYKIKSTLSTDQKIWLNYVAKENGAALSFSPTAAVFAVCDRLSAKNVQKTIGSNEAIVEHLELVK